MKYYTFLPQFHKDIHIGLKHSTIRQKAKVNPGERFALRYWTGLAYRSPMGFLGTAMCTAVHNIRIHQVGISTGDKSFKLSPSDLAKMEGFKSRIEMVGHFAARYSLPYSGVLTIWDPDSFIPGTPDLEFIRWFDGRDPDYWKSLVDKHNAEQNRKKSHE